MTVWIYILLSSTCSVLIAHLLNLTEFRKLNTLRVLTVNYLTGALIAYFVAGEGLPDISAPGLVPAVFLAILTGGIFIVNYFTFSKSVFYNGIGVSVSAMRISLIIPVIVSTFWYSESLLTRQWAGIVVVFFVLGLFISGNMKAPGRSSGTLRKSGRNRKKSQVGVKSNAKGLSENSKWFSGVASGNMAWLLLLLFLFTGTGDSILKIYEADFSLHLSKYHFMAIVFLFSSLVGLAVLLFGRRCFFPWPEVVMGVGVGVTNLYAVLFLIEALTLTSGGIVFASVNILTVFGGTCLGIWRWGDELTAIQWAAVALTLVAILMML